MESIVFFGKGGIGKSTVASNISVIFAAGGRKVLHVGCDPKGDSTLALAGRRVRHFADGGVFSGEAALRASIHPSLFRNINCVEAGGPQAGVGCAGAGIGAMLDIMEEFSILEKDGYDAAVFDVLGDVVCGGFAAPLRRGLAGKAVIVVSEEMLSLYAANKLIAMVNNYARNGVWLAGLAVNAKDREAVRLAEAFAAAARTRVLGVIPRDPAVARAEKMHRPVIASDPKSPAAIAMVRLAAAIQASRRPVAPPRFLGDAEFQELFSGSGPARAISASRVSLLPPAEILRRAGFKITGIVGGQVLCSWRGRAGAFNVIVSSTADARPGMTLAGDWALCFAPDAARESSDSRTELDAVVSGMVGVSFDDFFDAFSGGTDFYRNINAFDDISSHALPGGAAPRDPHVGFGQWHRFVFPAEESISVPPGAVMLEHGDMECRFSSATRTPLSAFQRSAAGLTGSGAVPVCPGLPKDDPSQVNTGFTYADAVRGDEEKVEAALRAAARITGRGGLVEFYNTCSPMLLATDVKAHIHRISSEAGVTILRENLNSFNSGNSKKVKVRAGYVAARLKALGRRKHIYDVNLSGFGAAREPLEDLLRAAGLRTAPAELEFYSGIAASALQVLPVSDAVMEQGLCAAGKNFLIPPAPYGLAATRDWMKGVLAALGRRSPAGPGVKTYREYAVLSAKASAFAAGFVLQVGEMAELCGGPPRKGVPVLAFMAEAGFKLRMLVYAPTHAAVKMAGEEFKKLPPAVRRGATLSSFASPDELYALLRRARTLRLLYSDIPMDARAAVVGKASFSPLVFEPGYEGAVATLRRLNALCVWNFNEKYPSRKLF